MPAKKQGVTFDLGKIAIMLGVLGTLGGWLWVAAKESAILETATANGQRLNIVIEKLETRDDVQDKNTAELKAQLEARISVLEDRSAR